MMYPNVCSFYWFLLNHGGVKIGCFIESINVLILSIDFYALLTHITETKLCVMVKSPYPRLLNKLYSLSSFNKQMTA